MMLVHHRCFIWRQNGLFNSILRSYSCNAFHTSRHWNSTASTSASSASPPSTNQFDRRNTDTAQRYNILFFGSDGFAVESLNALVNAKETSSVGLIANIEVVTPPDKPAGRGLHLQSVPIKQAALKHGLTIHTAPPKSLKEWNVPVSQIHASPFNLGVVVSFGYFLPSHVIGAFEHRCINVHPSLLPRYRGAAPIEYAILNGDKETGVSIIELHERVWDAGRILKQVRCNLSSDTAYTELHSSLSQLGAKALLETILLLPHLKVTALAQDSSLAIKAPKINKEMAHINFDEMTSQDVYRRYLAIGHRYPLYAMLRGKRVQLLQLSPVPDLIPGAEAENTLQLELQDALCHNNEIEVGTIAVACHKRYLFVKCREGWVKCEKFKVEGKREVHAKDFINGMRIKGGEMFG